MRSSRLFYRRLGSTRNPTYWRSGPAFPDLLDRRDHPGPPVRKLITAGGATWRRNRQALVPEEDAFFFFKTEEGKLG